MINGKPLICISPSGMQPMASDARGREWLMQNVYTNAVSRAGGVPIVAAERCAEELAELCDGLLVSGGADLDPAMYGEEILNDSVKIQPDRDALEKPLLEAFLKRGKPIFGICRGCQLINVVMGGSLYQDLLEQKGWIHFHLQMRHDVYVEEDSILGRLFGRQFKVNSTHHQSVKELAPGFRVTARSVEGIVEAFEHETLPIFATQFHPERLTGDLWDDRTADFAPLFAYFIDLVKKHSEK